VEPRESSSINLFTPFHTVQGKINHFPLICKNTGSNLEGVFRIITYFNIPGSHLIRKAFYAKHSNLWDKSSNSIWQGKTTLLQCVIYSWKIIKQEFYMRKDDSRRGGKCPIADFLWLHKKMALPSFPSLNRTKVSDCINPRGILFWRGIKTFLPDQTSHRLN
jgi:hypothetical protein